MNNKNHKPIRSFVRRQGRMTKAQTAAFDTLWSRYGVEMDLGLKNRGLLDLNSLFGRKGPKILEIGFGMGEALLVFAQQHPDQDFIGIDVHKPGIGAVLMGIQKLQLTNINLFCGDALDLLNQKIPDNSLDGVHLFFPDPWPKKRHHKRRLIQEPFVELIRTKLKIAGYIHLATDWENYAEQMLEVMTNSNEFINIAGQGRFTPRPESRPLTKFENRGEKLGHKVWDLIFVRKG